MLCSLSGMECNAHQQPAAEAQDERAPKACAVSTPDHASHLHVTHVAARVARSNDAFDAETGVDAAKAESVVNLLRGNRRGVLAASNACLLGGAALLSRAIASAVRTCPSCPPGLLRSCIQTGCIGAAQLGTHAWGTWHRSDRSAPVMLRGCHAQGDARVGAALAAAICMGYLYQGPPFRCRAPSPGQRPRRQGMSGWGFPGHPRALPWPQAELQGPRGAALLPSLWAAGHLRLLPGTGGTPSRRPLSSYPITAPSVLSQPCKGYSACNA